MYAKPSLRAQRSNPRLHLRRYGLLRCARNDVERPRHTGYRACVGMTTAAGRTNSPPQFSDRKTRPATARRGRIRIDHTERRADQIVDEINLGACEERYRGRIDQHHRALARDHEVVLGLGVVDVELVLEAGAAAALDGDAQHGAVAFGLEDFPDAAGGPLADGDGSGHGMLSGPSYPIHLVWGVRHS